MGRALRLLIAGLALMGSTFAVFGENLPSTVEASPIVLRIADQDVVTLRATINGTTPASRVRFIEEHLKHMTLSEMGQPVSLASVILNGQAGHVFMVGDRALFTLYDADLDAAQRTSKDAVVQSIAETLRQSLADQVHQYNPRAYLFGLLYSTLATVLAYVLFKGLQLGARHVLEHLKHGLDQSRGQKTGHLRLGEHGWLLAVRCVRLVLVFGAVAIAYLWLTYVLESFPITQALGQRLLGFLGKLLLDFGNSAVDAIPGVITVAVVLFLTKAINDAVASMFRQVSLGKVIVPGVHTETASATRRLVAILIWGCGIAIAYPYLPLANSDAFKGLSVMFGFMLTLGSAGIVTQVMSGLVLIYSRALRAGDFVSIGEVTGVVKEMGVLSTKVINQRNEEITIPNAVLVGNPIKNFTSGGGERGALVSTSVTIGYDTPWRQVEAMLIAAAEKTPGLRAQPKPFVMQKGLQDFYVEYELYAYIDKPLERLQILSGLHAAIQDEFNTWGVQIMSPHFVLQPKKDVTVDRDRWFTAPAQGQGDKGR